MEGVPVVCIHNWRRNLVVEQKCYSCVTGLLLNKLIIRHHGIKQCTLRLASSGCGVMQYYLNITIAQSYTEKCYEFCRHLYCYECAA